jgi:hypothetical protein
LWDEVSEVYEKLREDDLADSTRKINLGLIFGLGFEVPFSKGKMAVEGRYDLRVINIYRWGTRWTASTRPFS